MGFLVSKVHYLLYRFYERHYIYLRWRCEFLAPVKLLIYRLIESCLDNIARPFLASDIVGYDHKFISYVLIKKNIKSIDKNTAGCV